MEIDENGKQRKTVLVITQEQKNSEYPTVKWTYPDEINPYELIGILHDIQTNLLSKIEDIDEDEI